MARIRADFAGSATLFAPDDETKSDLPGMADFHGLLELDGDTADLDLGAHRVYAVQQRILAAEPASLYLIAPIFRRADMSRENFDHHWSTSHGPLAIEHHPGMIAYRQNLVTEVLSTGAPAFDGIAQCGFANREAFEQRFFASEESKKIIGRDTRAFVDVTRWQTALATEHVLTSER